MKNYQIKSFSDFKNLPLSNESLLMLSFGECLNIEGRFDLVVDYLKILALKVSEDLIIVKEATLSEEYARIGINANMTFYHKQTIGIPVSLIRGTSLKDFIDKKLN